MAAVTEAPSRRAGAPEWAQKYPPLVTLAVALLLAIAVMPSALTLPQTNPTQTLEYAPVPPDDDEPPPPVDGNFSSLGLSGSQSIEAGGAEGGNNMVPIAPPAVVRNPTTKRCVGNPPRQTEDPIAPPCVAYFAGDNGGATYHGVTREEIRVLIYLDGFVAHLGGSRGREERPQGEYYDLFEPPSPRGEHTIVTGFRAWQRYFNERFQTYGRAVHFFMYFNANDTTPEGRRADAADNYSKIRPFAVVAGADQGNEQDYVEFMARKGVMNFGTFVGRSQKFFNDFPKLIWGYDPMIEYKADYFGGWACKKLVPHPASMSGNPTDNGRKRVLGMWRTEDESWPDLILLAELVKKKIEGCGGEIAVEATFPVCCLAQNNSQNPDYAATAMAEMQQAGVTTIIWPGGIEPHACRAAQGTGYRPEWVLLGDGTMDTNWPMQLSAIGTCFDRRSIAVSAEVLEPALEESRCYQAVREVDKSYARSDFEYICEYYRNLFQLFTGIQVAGPKLNPASVDKGFHAIPPVQHKDPQTPACFYNDRDYTCVKDAQAQWWDQSGRAPGDNRQGCWRSIQSGKRYYPTVWPAGNIDAQITPQDPCNARSVRVLWRPA